MCARWSKTAGFDPAIFLRGIAAPVKIEGDTVGFAGVGLDDAKAILADQMEFHPDVAEIDRDGLFWTALVAAAKTGGLNADRLRQLVEINEHDYLKLPIQEFALLSSISIDRQQIL